MQAVTNFEQYQLNCLIREIEIERKSYMKMWHVVLLAVVVFLIASKYPSTGQMLLGKVGL